MRCPLPLFPLSVAALLPAQQPVGFTLRQPFGGAGAEYATHPTTGNPVRYDGFDLSLGPVPDLWEWTGNGWRRYASLPQPPTGMSNSSRSLAMATDTGRGELVLLPATGNLTWRWNGAQWRSQPNPPLLLGRFDTAMAWDSGRGRIVMFGGGTLLQMHNDTWEWDGAGWSARAVGIAPAPRYGHRLAYEPARGRTLLFGGRGSLGLLADTWEWDGAMWRQRFPTQSPSARTDYQLAHDPARGRTVLHGGVGLIPIPVLADTWEWDGTDWRSVTPGNAPPPLRERGMVYAPSRQRVELFGLADAGPVTYAYDGAVWTGPQAVLPAIRSRGAMAADPVRGEVLLFGGTNSLGGTSLGDTWTWNGEIWRPAQPATQPGGRQSAAMAFDAARGELLLFGGVRRTAGSTAVLLGDTWAWTGTDWAPRPGGPGPSPRYGHGLAYHAPSQRVVLFGGRDLTSALQTGTWLWDGSTWSLASPAAAPPLRADAAMVGTGQQVVLFGGSTWTSAPGGGTNLDDTWVWNGTTWASVPTANRPEARSGAAAAYDTTQQRVLLFSGYMGGSGIEPGDLWAFDGVDWSPVPAPEAPDERSGAHLAQDPRRGELVLFGGLRFRDQNDTWTLGAAGAHAPLGAGCAGSLGVPTLQAAAESLPELGGTVALDLDGLPHGFGLLTMGFSAQSFGGQSLPLALAPFGMPGCALHSAADAVAPLAGAGPTARWHLPLPPVPGLLGVVFWNQGFAFDPPANAAGLTTSNALRTAVGH